MSGFDRASRTAPSHHFNGGHGIGKVVTDYRTHVGPVRKEWRTFAVSLMFGVMMVGFAVVTA